MLKSSHLSGFILAARLTPLQQFRACGHLGNDRHSLFIGDASTHRRIDAFIHTKTSIVHTYNLAPSIGVSILLQYGVQSVEWMQFIESEPSNTQQCDFRGSTASRVRNGATAVGNQRLKNIIDELTSLVRQRAAEEHHNRPPMQEYGMCGSQYQAPPFQQQQQQPVQQLDSSSSLEELTKQLTTNNMKFQEDICATLQDLQT
ncbi:hypothetical protein CR513_05785, partial [Mucuna pruriens]